MAKKYLEPKTIFIEPGAESADEPFKAAKKAAEAAAEEHSGDVMLIAWKDSKTGETSPSVVACMECYLDGWEMYAASRGADLKVDVDAGRYVFIFKSI